jgi:hypothetical protein
VIAVARECLFREEGMRRERVASRPGYVLKGRAPCSGPTGRSEPCDSHEESRGDTMTSEGIHHVSAMARVALPVTEGFQT